MPLTNKQKRFADEYLIDCNATRAYKAAYPHIKNDNVAKSAGSRLLAKVNVKSYIDERLAEIKSSKTADAQEVIEYLTSVLRGESEAEEIVVVGDGQGYSKAVNVKKAPGEKDRIKAAELLGKRLGLFTDKIDVNGTLPVQIVDDVSE